VSRGYWQTTITGLKKSRSDLPERLFYGRKFVAACKPNSVSLANLPGMVIISLVPTLLSGSSVPPGCFATDGAQPV